MGGGDEGLLWRRSWMVRQDYFAKYAMEHDGCSLYFVGACMLGGSFVCRVCYKECLYQHAIMLIPA